MAPEPLRPSAGAASASVCVLLSAAEMMPAACFSAAAMMPVSTVPWSRQ
jgi:hypothetical protein